MRKLFGTDGIRGPANEFPLDDPTIHAIGHALAEKLTDGREEAYVIVGRDTRESGERIARALAAGLREGGAIPVDGGVIPTPAVAWICRNTRAIAGVSISASHNPWQDNGVKIFADDGMKLPDEDELALEQRLETLRDENLTISEEAMVDGTELVERYVGFLVADVGEGRLEGIRVVLDPGHGAVSGIAREIFERAGATVHLINAEPDGRNINADAGSLHPEQVGETVRSVGADLGVAFDGDADRAIFVDDTGRVRDGDEVIFIWARALKEDGSLTNDTVVTTVMSNLGFEKELERAGIRLIRAQVGDKYVLEKMLESGAILGGEQSGHVIDLQSHTTGDGLHTALNVCAIVKDADGPMSGIKTFTPIPQLLINRAVASKPSLENLPKFQRAREEADRELAGNGRILVRYSGTEPKARIMVEGTDRTSVERLANQLADVLTEEIEELSR